MPVGRTGADSPTRFRLVPTNDHFFVLFRSAAANAAECSGHLVRLVSGGPDAAGAAQAVISAEHTGDAVIRAILERLASAFVTPFDREDIHALAEEIDDVVDELRAVVALLELPPLDGMLPEVVEQAQLVQQMTTEVVALMDRLHSMRGLDGHLDRLRELERQGDVLYRKALLRVFSGDYPALEVMAWKDVIARMERAMDTMEDIHDRVRSIALKHA